MLRPCFNVLFELFQGGGGRTASPHSASLRHRLQGCQGVGPLAIGPLLAEFAALGQRGEVDSLANGGPDGSLDFLFENCQKNAFVLSPGGSKLVVDSLAVGHRRGYAIPWLERYSVDGCPK
jgi:hypothetical protein